MTFTEQDPSTLDAVEPAPVAGGGAHTYDEYADNRQQLEGALVLVRWWHRRMLGVARRALAAERPLHVVELGVGFGWFADAVRDAGDTYTGVEMNAGLASTVRARGHRVEVATVPPFPARVAPADLVWLSHVLEHARDWGGAREMMAAAAAATAPGGAVCVISPDYRAWRGSFWDIDWSHGYPTTPRRVAQLMREVGLEPVVVSTHVGTVTQPLLRLLLGLLVLLVPTPAVDAVTARVAGGKTLATSFLSLFGWRQVFVIGVSRH